MRVKIERSLRIDLARSEYDEITDVHDLLERLLLCFHGADMIVSKTTGEVIKKDELIRMKGILAALTYNCDEYEWTL